ncbi:hypothetical protein OKA05_28540 [Luteolibacter arcticus]|uniref:Uncharacterized protein n=1 Tax=Luteolibacter arcticus TaxID=1581411 RepID=A0ABT3GSM7_9BACT|nr:hypothetical protein [Luteolibacter arcticus]MCW1926534.1 hypothetical protein [Luteolibacter arcticus]
MNPDSLIAATDSMDGQARAAATRDAANAWLHAARIVRLFRSAPRVLRQLRQHAGFTASMEKAAAYRGAMEVLARHVDEAITTPAPRVRPLGTRNSFRLACPPKPWRRRDGRVAGPVGRDQSRVPSSRSRRSASELLPI